eukprot:Trichotokara_eunicae@DN5242_c0_g2_i1.p1
MRQREALKNEWRERFGTEYPEDKDKDEQKFKSSKDEVIFRLNVIVKKNEDPAAVVTCLKTLNVYLKNAKENPTELKFLSIRKENKAFATRVAPLIGCIEFLNCVGFKEKTIAGGESFSIEGVPDGFIMGLAMQYLDIHLRRLGAI